MASIRRFLPVAILGAALFGVALVAAPAAFAEDLPPTSEFFDEYDQDADGRVTKDEFRGSSEVFRLLDKDGDGAVSPDELGLPADYKPDPAAQKKRKQAAQRAQRGGRAMEQLRKRIMKMDANKDGRVARDEWKGPAEAFDRIDRNKDGFLDAKDGGNAFGKQGGKTRRGGKGKDGGMDAKPDPAALEKMRAQAKERFALLDKNQDGKLTEDEVPEQARGFLAQADADKDGAVSSEEFMGFVSKRARGGSDRARRGGSDRRRRGGRLNAGMLRRWDRNQDGKVDADEFPGRDEAFARLDADRDGVLTEADIKAAKAAAKGGAAKPKAPVTEKSGNLIEVQDTDGDGRLHRAEFRGSAAEWKRLDKDGDGWVTLEEVGAK